MNRRSAVRAALVLALVIGATPLTADVLFSGSVGSVVTLNVEPTGGYDDSPLNVANSLGLTDVACALNNQVRLSASTGAAAFDLWMRLSYSPLAELLGAPSVADHYVADILRSALYWRPADWIEVGVGRQALPGGFGYGWNPVALMSLPGNPADPDAEMRGVDSLSVTLSPTHWVQANLYAALPAALGIADYDQLLTGGSIVFRLGAVEAEIAGLLGGETPELVPDPYPNALGAALFADLFGIGLYAEGVWRPSSRRGAPNPLGYVAVREADTWTALLGAEYFFGSGVVLNAEYFYNGEGYDGEQRADYVAALGAMTADTAPLLYALYTPGSFARHYVLLNATVPVYVAETVIMLGGIVSPDSSAVGLFPSVEITLGPEGELTASAGWSGLFSWDDQSNSEVELSPVRHSFMVDVAYHF